MVAHLDGDNRFGFVITTHGIAKAIKHVEIYSIRIVIVNYLNYFSIVVIYVL